VHMRGPAMMVVRVTMTVSVVVLVIHDISIVPFLGVRFWLTMRHAETVSGVFGTVRDRLQRPVRLSGKPLTKPRRRWRRKAR